MTEQPQPAERPPEPTQPPVEPASTEPVASYAPATWEPGEPEGELEAVVDALRDVVDPELGVNIVDLGLVYSVQRDEAGNVTVDMTLTSPMCPLTDQLEYDTHYMLMSLARTVTINWVWLPPWTLDNITDDGREQLRAIGYSL
jgi:metal-sulfur cluster biosynthetic enzyme